MSIYYPADRRLLNEHHQRDLMDITIKELAEVERCLLREKEEREAERRLRRDEAKNMRHNFVNLLTLAQYEHNRAQFEADESAARLTFNEKISQRSYTNFQYLRNFNFVQKARYSTLLQMIKSNFKGMDFLVRCENAFDCRPYNGPKTPPTPTSTFSCSNKQNLTQILQQNYQWSSNCSIPSWSVDDMLFYLHKYKEEFKKYSGSIKKENVKVTSTPVTNLFSKPKNLNNKKVLDNDSEFYKDLIEKHQKSLEMIDNVEIQLNQNCFPIISKTLDTEEIKDVNLKIDQNSFPFNINQIRNQIYENYFNYLMKNPMILNDENLAEFSANLINSSNDISILTTTNNITSAVLQDVNQCVESKTGISTLKNKNNDQKNDDSDSILEVEGESQNNPGEEFIDVINIYEEGEIIDSGDESKALKIKKKLKVNKKKYKKDEKRIEKKKKNYI